MRIALALSCCAAALVASMTAARAANLALVLAVDVSESVTTERYVLQHDGIARAFENPQLVEAINNTPGGIEVLVLEWSDPDRIAITVGWTRVANRASAASFAAAVRATTRTSHGLTAIGAAMQAGGAAFDHMPEPAEHKVIDVSGDGSNNDGRDVTAARDDAVAAGITVNGLPIVEVEPGLDDYYRRNVIGGPGAFVVVARDIEAFAEAVLRKLLVEVAYASPAGAGDVETRKRRG